MSVRTLHAVKFWNELPESIWKQAAYLAAFSIAYFLAAKLGIATRLPPEGIVVMWPPNAIVLAALVRVEQRKWWPFFLAAVATETAAAVPTYPLWVAVSAGVINFSEGAIAATLFLRFTGGSKIRTVQQFAIYLAAGPLFAAGVTSSLGALLYKLGAPEIDYLHYWRIYWMGDGLGLLVIGTILLSWSSGRYGTLGRRLSIAMLEVALIAAGLTAAAIYAFIAEGPTPRVYLMFPFLIWAASRFGIRGASLAIAAVTALSIGTGAANTGPFAALSSIDDVLLLQGMIAAVAVSIFMLAFSTEETQAAAEGLRLTVEEKTATAEKLRSAYADLERLNQSLDDVVETRTQELRHALSHNKFLLSEVNHRVKNNLQLISGLVSLHGRQIEAPDVKNKLAAIKTQITSIATIYDILHQMESAQIVDFCKVVPVLCRNIEAAGGAEAHIEGDAKGEARMSADTAVSLALAVNELVTNSIKHGGEERPPTIIVACEARDQILTLVVRDDGPGFPEGFDIMRGKGFGMRMVQDVIGRTGGSADLGQPSMGAEVRLTVPIVVDPPA